jgi:quercetin dioxygenase-like cupin family protein
MPQKLHSISSLYGWRQVQASQPYRSRRLVREHLGQENTMYEELSGPGVIEWLNVRYKTILPGAETDGAMSIVDSLCPVGSGPPRHVHEREDETFVILTGECEFWLEGQTIVKRPGESIFVPRGREHTFRVVGVQPGRHLTILTPSGFENFFAEMAQAGYRIPEDMEQIGASAARHSLRFTGPPLRAE